MLGSTKKGEILRTREVCRNIIEREGNTDRGMLLLVYFLKDQGRSLDELTMIWSTNDREMAEMKAREKAANDRKEPDDE